MKDWNIIQGCCLDVLRTLPSESVHCCITSPPYFALRSYLPAGHPDKAKEIGSEPTVEAFVATMVAVFEEVRRVLRDDGVLWLNLGDSYCSAPAGNKTRTDWLPEAGSRGRLDLSNYTADKPKDFGTLKPKDLIGIPWRVAFALQSAGWWLRSDIPWVKRSPMPESVTDRPAKSLEYVFLLTKAERYYFDMEAVKREAETTGRKGLNFYSDRAGAMGRIPSGNEAADPLAGVRGDARNFRNSDLWFDSLSQPHGLCGIDDELVGLDVTSEALKEAHFAAFPCKLVEPLIKCGSSQKGCCPSCGSPWKRVVEKKRAATRPGEDSKVHAATRDPAMFAGPMDRTNAEGVNHSQYVKTRMVGNRDPERHCTTSQTVGWEASCDCPEHEPIPCTVLDPFTGAATVALVALRLGRRFIGSELNEAYCDLGRKRIESDNPMFNTAVPVAAEPERLLFDTIEDNP